jgi:hypothetical protein
MEARNNKIRLSILHSLTSFTFFSSRLVHMSCFFTVSSMYVTFWRLRADFEQAEITKNGLRRPPQLFLIQPPPNTDFKQSLVVLLLLDQHRKASVAKPYDKE